MNKIQLFMKSNSSNILTCVSVFGVIGTTALAITNTPKAMLLLKDHDEDTILEKIKIALPAYIPTIISACGTIACIIGSNYLNIKKQESLTSAYILLDNAFKEYRKRINEEYGDRSEIIYKEVSREQLIKLAEDYSQTLFFEFNSMRFFEADIHKVLQAECKAKLQLSQYGQLSLNDYYSYLGISPSSYGEVIGWSTYQMETQDHQDELEFTYERVIMSNGIICYNIITNVEPTMDHFCF